MRPRSRTTLLLLAAGLAMAGTCACRGSDLRGTVFPDPDPAADFTLDDQQGRTFRMGEQRGKVVLLTFGYTFCPDVCPMTLSIWADVARRLGADADRVAFVFVTVDPERDTPDRLREHLAVFNPRFVGLTGPVERMQPVYDAYYVHHEKTRFGNSQTGYLVDHTTRTFLVDPQGRLFASHAFGANAGDIAHDIRQLLRSGDPVIEIHDAWARPAAGETAAVYLTIENPGEADRLLRGRTQVCRATEIHRTTLQDDRMSMAPVEGGVEIPRRGRVEFRPGDLHVMLIGLEHALAAGDRFDLQLEFERGGARTVSVEVGRR